MITNNPAITDINAQLSILPDSIVETVSRHGFTYIQLTDPCLDEDKDIWKGDYWIIADPDDGDTWGDVYGGSFEDFMNTHNAGTSAGYKDIYCWDGNKWVHVFDTATVADAHAELTVQADRITSEVVRVNAIEGELSTRITQTAESIVSEAEARKSGEEL